MSFETLYHLVNLIVPEGWSFNLERKCWRYSHRAGDVADSLCVWATPDNGSLGESFKGTENEILDQLVSRFPRTTKAAA